MLESEDSDYRKYASRQGEQSAYFGALILPYIVRVFIHDHFHLSDRLLREPIVYLNIIPDGNPTRLDAESSTTRWWALPLQGYFGRRPNITISTTSLPRQTKLFSTYATDAVPPSLLE